MSTLREWHVKVVDNREDLGDEDLWMEPILAVSAHVAVTEAFRSHVEEGDVWLDDGSTIYAMVKPADDEEDVTYWEAEPEFVLRVNAKRVSEAQMSGAEEMSK